MSGRAASCLLSCANHPPKGKRLAASGPYAGLPEGTLAPKTQQCLFCSLHVQFKYLYLEIIFYVCFFLRFVLMFQFGKLPPFPFPLSLRPEAKLDISHHQNSALLASRSQTVWLLSGLARCLDWDLGSRLVSLGSCLETSHG